MSGKTYSRRNALHFRSVLALVAWGCLLAVLIVSCPAYVSGQIPSTDRHVPELAAYLDHVQIAEPVAYRQLAIYPVLLKDHPTLRGDWLTLDRAIARGVLDVTEKGGGGSVPVVIVENRSRHEHIFIMAGEVISGGKQTRTVRKDVVLAPGQRIELDVFCVEARRWEGEPEFSAAKALVPQSIQKELRKGADQQRVWSEVARNNAALKAENATGSLERALKSKDVEQKLAKVREAIVPKVPRGTVGFLFVDGHRPVGADLFGDEEIARDLLPKLLDSYAVDLVLLRPSAAAVRRTDHRAAIDFFERICRAGSQRDSTPGSGSGIRTRSDRLLGDGVSLGSQVVHYGVQVEDRIVPKPEPRPIYPRQQRSR